MILPKVLPRFRMTSSPRRKMNSLRDVCGQFKRLLLHGRMTTSEPPKLQSVQMWSWNGQPIRTLFGTKKDCPSKKMMLRGFGMQRLRTHAVQCCFLLVVVGSCKYYYNRCRKQAYLNFYKTYDPESDFERMMKAGVFQSVTPEGEPGTIS